MTVANIPTPIQGKEWFTSSFSSGAATCVEVKFTIGAILVRDSKDRRADHPVMGFATPGWSSFLNSITRE